MRLFCHLSVVIAFLAAASLSFSQGPGQVDATFDTEPVADMAIRCVVPVGDGKIYIGGVFTMLRGQSRPHIARLNSDGSVDPTFTAGGAAGPSGALNFTKVLCLAVQADGKVLVGGDFSRFNGVARKGVARLHSDGSLDTTFNPGTGVGGTGDVFVSYLAAQANGKVVIGGTFTSFNGTLRSGFARLNSDGSLDTAFDPGTGASGEVRAMVVQADGKVVIGGLFASFNGTARNRLARLNEDGSLDASFDTGSGPNDWINSLALQADGKLLVGGTFTTFDGLSRRYIVRLNDDGSVDTGLNSGTGITFEFIPDILSIAPQADGKIVIGGRFNTYRGVQRLGVARMNSNGTLDTAFDPGLAVGYWAAEQDVRVAVQADGKVLVGGGPGLIRLEDDGQLDSSFDHGSGAKDQIFCMAPQDDGKVIIGGVFRSYAGRLRNRIARINGDGSLDLSFDPGLGVRNVFFSNYPTAVHAVAVQPDGRVLISGDFDDINGLTRYRVARLLSNGQPDPSFNPGTVTASTVKALAVQPDGKVVMGGFFTSYAGTLRDRLVRLNSDGSLDTTFGSDVGPDDVVTAVVIQPDGKVIIGGAFTRFSGVARKHIARLNSDGSLDTSFNAGAGAGVTTYPSVTSLALQPDGKVLVGGLFATFGGKPRVGVVRLQSNGSVDTSFTPDTGSGAYTQARVRSLLLQSDGRILLGGEFTTFTGVVSLNVDGRLNRAFKGGAGAGLSSAIGAPRGTVSSMALQADGSVFVGGFFDQFNGTASGNLTRLLNDADSTGGAFSFGSALYLASPTSTSATITIRRGQERDAADVTLTTQDGAATGAFNAAVAGLDYQPLQSVIHFAEGEAVKEVSLTLLPRADALPNRRLRLSLSDPTGDMVLGSVPETELRLLLADTQPPVLTVTLPSAGARSVALPSPFLLKGTVGDNQGIDRVEVEYNGTTFSMTPSPGSQGMALPWEIPFTPQGSGSVSLAFTAYDLSGLRTSVTRSFEYERRYEFQVLRSALSATPAHEAGSITVSGAPSSAVTPMLPEAPGSPQRWAVSAEALVTVRARAKIGHIFSHWLGLPVGAVTRGHEISFPMPAADVEDLTAVFMPNPFTASGGAAARRRVAFQGLLREHGSTAPGVDVVGFVSATLLPGSGTLSGKIVMDGRMTPFTAALQGDGSAWFQSGRSVVAALPIAGERMLGLTWSVEGLAFTVTGVNDKISTGLARPSIYHLGAPVPGGLLGANGVQGYYTLALPAVAQSPAKPHSDYPQGAGFAGLTLLRHGTLRLAGTLADGVTFTASTFLTEDDQAEFFVMLPPPGVSALGAAFPFVIPKARDGKSGAFLGTLSFVESQTGAQVSSEDMSWFRAPASVAPTVRLAYRSGWPGGIALGAEGALYDPSQTVQAALSLGASHATLGNARLLLSGGKLVAAPLETSPFNVIASRAIKVTPADKTFSLTLLQATGLLRGTLTPDWPQASPSLPRFQGVLVQSGDLQGGHGFFMSNAQNDPDPESGAVLLEGRDD